jgi:4-alpha-glucanotransferase
MSDTVQQTFPSIPARGSGVLLHVTSLPSPHGIGDVGPAAIAWVDRLYEAGQRWWQLLPLGPTGYGNSPYQLLSSFAGNELLISPDGLIEDGLLQASDCEANAFPSTAIDYNTVIPYKRRLLLKAWNVFRSGNYADLRSSFEQFCEENRGWLDDYALFRALKARHNGEHYLKWPQELVRRVPAALVEAQRALGDHIDQVRFAQFLAFHQAARLRDYARSKGVRLIGDLPFFVSPDSSDVWSNPELFLLDEHHQPRFVAGVPPDYFSADGQLWGNPVYDWDALHQTGYAWWLSRLRARLAYVDVVRLDHFRAFAAAWHVPAGMTTAQKGEWKQGPGSTFFQAAQAELGTLPFIAEDLGLITPDVSALREEFHLPGMRVLQFAFDGNPANPHLPKNYATNTVAYTGTHDNSTTRGWYEALSDQSKQHMWAYLNRAPGETAEVAASLIEVAWSSAAALAMVPLQDLLNLGDEARMNVPGRSDGNWGWRCTDDMLTPAAFQWLCDLTRAVQRS